MATLTYSGTPQNGDTGDVVSSKMTTTLTEIRTAVNAVADDQITSPNNSVYKTLLTQSAYVAADTTAGTYIVGREQLTASGGTINSGHGFFPIYFDDADFTVGSKTTKLRLRAQVCTNATAWSSVTATFALFPITFAGAADTLVATLGANVASSTVAIANPSASSVNQGNSGDFTIPADGQYCIGVVLSAILTNNAVALLTAQLQTRNV